MYKDILRRVIAIISQPRRAWHMLAKKQENHEEFLARFVYPLIGLMTVVAFVGVLFTRKEFDVELALKSSIKTLVSSFGGFFLAAYVMNEIWQGWLNRQKDMQLWQRFVGYSSSLMFALNIVLMLLPEFFFLRIFILYTLYIIWEGADIYLGVTEPVRLRFVVIATGVILLMPNIIEFVLALLMPGLSF
ncbi:MAG: YIP1 family protein [Parabacteroides sp.]